MPAYFVFHNRVRDAQKMQEYIPKAIETLVPYRTEVLVLDENTTVVEGVLDLPRTIVIQFASRDEAIDWYNSAAYRAVRQLRLEATEGFAVLVDGFSSAALPAGGIGRL